MAKGDFLQIVVPLLGGAFWLVETVLAVRTRGDARMLFRFWLGFVGAAAAIYYLTS